MVTDTMLSVSKQRRLGCFGGEGMLTKCYEVTSCDKEQLRPYG